MRAIAFGLPPVALALCSRMEKVHQLDFAHVVSRAHDLRWAGADKATAPLI
jgi:hypothetical protein